MQKDLEPSGEKWSRFRVAIFSFRSYVWDSLRHIPLYDGEGPFLTCDLLSLTKASVMVDSHIL